jgi:transcriptional regulator with XRE-family HTH domain
MKQELNFKTFSKAIRQKRLIDLNITGREAAKVIGISYPTLSRVENSNMPDLITYANICKLLGVPMEKFIITSKKINN